MRSLPFTQFLLTQTTINVSKNNQNSGRKKFVSCDIMQDIFEKMMPKILSRVARNIMISSFSVTSVQNVKSGKFTLCEINW